MLNRRGLDTVRVSKVKGHADDAMVLHGQVRQDDRLGNDAADEAADFGRRRVSPAVIDARRNLSGVCGHWYPFILDLHRFFIAIARAVVNHDDLGGTAPHPLVWSAGALRKRRRLVHSSEGLRRLRSAVCRVVWSRRQPLANVGAVLSLLDGPSGCDPAFCVVWFRFPLLRRYLALWPAEVGRVYRLLDMVSDGCPGHGPIHLLYCSAADIGFHWDSSALAWTRPGLPMLDNLAGPIQHFRSAILDAWRNKVALDLCKRQGFRGGPLLDVHGSLQLLNSSHVRERDKALLRTFLVGGVWNGFLLGYVRGQAVPCRFCGAPDHDGHLFWECPFPPLVEIRENPEFHDLMRLDKTRWPRCLLWHGWLPMLSGVNGASPWAVDASESAAYLVEVSLGRYSADVLCSWDLPGSFDHDFAASSLSDRPDVWTDGSSVLDRVTGVSASGAGFFADSSDQFWNDRRWGHVDGVVVGRDHACCRVFFLRSLGLFRLFRELRCRASFWLCRPPVLFILV